MSVKKTVYLLPGLGATGDAFKFLDFQDYERRVIQWIQPEKGEKLDAYVDRLKEQIEDPENSMLCGLSFGGIVAIELAKRLPVRKTIIISSVKTWTEFPNTIKLARLIPLHKLLKADFISKFSFWYWIPFGRISADDKQLIKSMIELMDGSFTDWCAEQAVYWKNTFIPDNVYHIHGTSDRIFPSFHIDNFYKIKGGTHYMIINRAEEINEYIAQILSDEREIVNIADAVKKSSGKPKKTQIQI
jgi:pimeloyl-ACP methyl ester carboxylesterase